MIFFSIERIYRYGNSKKIQLYVSDATGATKSAKYYRIPLPGDSKPANRTDNVFKDLVRYYAKVSGDKFYMGMVLKPAKDAFVIDEGVKPALAANLTPSIPEKLMNDGEGLIRFGTMYEYGMGYDNGNFLTGMDDSNFNENTNGDKTPYGYMYKKKNNVFSVVIESDTENDLSEFVPSNWQEFDSIDQVLADIRNWGIATPENRGPLYPNHTLDEVGNLSGYDMENLAPLIDIEAGTVTDEYHLIPDAYRVNKYDGQATITFTSDRATSDSKLYVLYYGMQAGHAWKPEVEEVTFTGNTAIVNFNGTIGIDGSSAYKYNQAVIQLSHDLIGHVNVTVAKN